MTRLLKHLGISFMATAAMLVTLVSLPAGVASAADSPQTLAQLQAETPPKPQVQVTPGQTVGFSQQQAFVQRYWNEPWLTPQERQYLESIPISVSEPTETAMMATAPAAFVAATRAGDPVMSGQCNYSTIGGGWWYHSYLGFSDNGRVITNVSTPNDYWANWYFAQLTGRFWHQYEGTGSANITYLDMGQWDYSQLGTSYIWYYMHGNGSWQENSVC